MPFGSSRRTGSGGWTSRLWNASSRPSATRPPSIVIASAGEVNAGDFDPLAAMADLAERHGAWLHVDGAFGLFASLSDRSLHLV